MDSIILAGGLGTRLKDLFPDIPKCLVKIDGTPFIDLLIKQLEKETCLSKIVLALGYRADQVISHVKDRFPSLSIEFSVEASPLGTGGALKRALPLTDSKHILVLNGDSYLNLPLEKMLQEHIKRRADITIASTMAENSCRFGTLTLSQEGQVLQFNEKDNKSQGGLINAGIYLINREIEKFFPKMNNFSLEKDLFSTNTGFMINCFEVDPLHASFIDIGTRDSYFEAQILLKNLGNIK